MSPPVRTIQTDVVIAGSGPGGATMARELSKKGKKVVLCEAGKNHQWLGKNSVLLLGMMDKMGMTFSKEGTWVLRPKTAGGASVVYCGTAVRPPAWLKEKYGIDLAEEVDEVYKEIPIQTLPDHLVGPAASKMMGAAQDMGLDWNLLDKWIRPEKCEANCGKCALGCTTGAKWTAREYIEEAQQSGAELLLQTTVDRVLTENGKAVGVRAKGPHGWMDIKAETVILSAGGQGTPPILQRSGVYDAGQGFFADPLVFVMGAGQGQGTKYDVTMTAGTIMTDDGIVMTDLIVPPLMFSGLMTFAGPRGWVKLPKVLNYRKTMGIMIKVRDGLDGRINMDESFYKPLDNDTWWKLNKGAALAEEILMKAGAKKEDVMQSAVIAAHPGGTVRIGELLDKDCQTPIQNCYCMDTTIIPEPWGLPPTVTVVAMAKRLANHLTVGAEARVAVQEPI
jgi:choline dehydrogenase-like flavoprotein